MDTNSLTVTEVAKMLRRVLKEASPGVKFSVRSSKYSGGSSIDVSWTDGPTSDQVRELASVFEGSYFDGMIDYKGSKYHTLDGEPVTIYCDYIFYRRESSKEALTSAIIDAVMHYGAFSVPTAEEFKSGYCLNTSPIGNYDGGAHHSWSNIIRRTLEKAEDWCEAPAELLPSPTAARIQSAGDDGYGQGRTGRITA